MAGSDDRDHCNRSVRVDGPAPVRHAARLRVLRSKFLGALVDLVGLRRGVVTGASMLPTLREGDRLLARRVGKVSDGDVVERSICG